MTDALQPLLPADAANLARLVLQAACQAPESDRFFAGPKVFISRLHAAMSALGYSADLATFKERLVELNRAGMISLRRLDMVAQADAALVEASELASGVSRWHCVEDASHAHAHNPGVGLNAQAAASILAPFVARGRIGRPRPR